MPTNEGGGRGRRIPPRRGNPEPEVPQAGVKQQVAQIPWLTLILSTGVTTLVGYAFIEIAKGAHRAIKQRREDKHEEIMAAKNPPPPKELPPPGVMPDGAFNLPAPGVSTPGVAPAHTGFGAPGPYPQSPERQGAAPYGHPLTEVSTPEGALRHEMRSMQHNVDGRLARLEEMLARHYGRGTG